MYFDRIFKIPAQGTKYYGFEFYGRCMNIKAKCTLEVGCGDGYISAWLAHAARENGGKHFSIDNDWTKTEKLIKISRAWNYQENWSIITSDSLTVKMDRFKKGIDFIFIDTTHTYEQTKAEIQYYSKYININGYMAFHDYYKEGSEVKKACDKFLPSTQWEKIKNNDYNKHNYQCGVLICRRK
ncbi:MAG: class I SAM-dependent methyltransferase [Candidatus Thorarchaeota archaeon]